MLITGRIRNVIKAVETHVFFYIRREMLSLDQSFVKYPEAIKFSVKEMIKELSAWEKNILALKLF